MGVLRCFSLEHLGPEGGNNKLGVLLELLDHRNHRGPVRGVGGVDLVEAVERRRVAALDRKDQRERDAVPRKSGQLVQPSPR